MELHVKEKIALQNEEGTFPEASAIKFHGPNNVRIGALNLNGM